MSFRDRPDMLVLSAPPAQLAMHYEYTRTTTVRDWSAFDRPARERMTARRIRPAKVSSIKRQAS